jgi:hypothetical protein
MYSVAYISRHNVSINFLTLNAVQRWNLQLRTQAVIIFWLFDLVLCGRDRWGWKIRGMMTGRGKSKYLVRKHPQCVTWIQAPLMRKWYCGTTVSVHVFSNFIFCSFQRVNTVVQVRTFFNFLLVIIFKHLDPVIFEYESVCLWWLVFVALIPNTRMSKRCRRWEESFDIFYAFSVFLILENLHFLIINCFGLHSYERPVEFKLFPAFLNTVKSGYDCLIAHFSSLSFTVVFQLNILYSFQNRKASLE